MSNSTVALDKSTIENGPSRVVPESHKWQPLNIAYVNIHDWEPKLFTVEEEATALADLKAVYPGEKFITGFKGSVININPALFGGIE